MAHAPKPTPEKADLAEHLHEITVLAALSPAVMRHVAARVTTVEVPAGEAVVREGDLTRDLYFLLAGIAEVDRGGVSALALGTGAEFGSLSLVTGKPRAATVRAKTPLRLAVLPYEGWTALVKEEPRVAFELLEGLFGRVRGDLVQMTDNVSALLQGRSVPRSAEVEVTLLTGRRRVRTGTIVRELLPRDVEGELVVGGLLGQKPVGLNTPIFSASTLHPLTLGHWEGRKIYSQSVGLLLLEAAHELDPDLDVRLGASRGTTQLVEVRNPRGRDLAALAQALEAQMVKLAKTNARFRREHWTVDEAVAHFNEVGWGSAAQLLRSWRQGTVPLVSCGKVYALSLGLTMPDTADLDGYTLTLHNGGLLLTLGARDPRRTAVTPPMRNEGMSAWHREWLAAMGIDSVGGFNELCISGEVKQLIRVSEGFHEKQIGRIADDIAAAKDRLRIIAIAGPSSSGKTTFIKRLRVQLQINGLNPIGLSLDDYYVDREKTVKDAKGEYDFEALEALDVPLLQAQVKRLLEGKTVKLAKYDFRTGRSSPEGGHTLTLRPGDVMMMEGIHGLNPGLLGDIPQSGQVFRVFVHPGTTLPFDRLTRVSATDIRLLRRIVRDRHQRGYKAQDTIMRWPSVQAGERAHIYPFQGEADSVFDTALIYEPSVLKVYAERYLLEVPADHAAYGTAYRLRQLIDHVVAIYPEHVPPTSIIREFIGGSGFEY